MKQNINYIKTPIIVTRDGELDKSYYRRKYRQARLQALRRALWAWTLESAKTAFLYVDALIYDAGNGTDLHGELVRSRRKAKTDSMRLHLGV